MKKSIYNVIGGDVSAGTTRLALWQQTSKERLGQPTKTKNIKTGEIRDFQRDALIPFLKECGLTTRQVHSVVLAPAGRIEGDSYCELTNQRLVLDTKAMDVPCILINDFKAKACFVGAEVQNKMLKKLVIRKGTRANTRFGLPLLIAGVGSGYGVATSVWNTDKQLYEPGLPSEASHQPLLVNLHDTMEVAVLSRLQSRNAGKFLTWETVLSTKKDGGLENAFETYSELLGTKLPADYLAAGNKAAWINVNSRAARRSKPLALTRKLVWTVFGRSLRSFAVGNVSEGGIFLTSGMAQQNLTVDGNPKKIDRELISLIEAGFTGWPTHQQWPREIPINLVLEKDDGLYGAGYAALRQIK